MKFSSPILFVLCSLFIAGAVAYNDYLGFNTKNFVVEMQSSSPGIAQVFFDGGNGYNELNSRTLPIQPEVLKKYVFQVTDQAIQSIRFDPLNVPGVISLKNARIETLQGKVIKTFLFKDFQPAQQIGTIETSDNVLLVHTTENATDPILTIDNSRIENMLNWTELIREHGWKYLVYALLSFLCLFGLHFLTIALPGKKAISPPTQPKTYSLPSRSFYPDFIRAFSICLIITYHFALYALESQAAGRLLFGPATNSFGHIGVSLFIILSGATLMLTYEQKFNTQTYIKKRFLSIYPLFWVTYLFFLVERFIVYRNIPEGQSWTFLLTIGAMDGFMLYKVPNFYLLGEWFLGMIVILYLLFPLLRTALLKYKYFTLLACACVVVLIQRYYHFDMDILRFPPSRLLEFALGMSFIHFFDDSGNKTLNFFLIAITGILFFSINALNLPLLLKMPAVGILAFSWLASVAQLFSAPVCRKSIGFLSTYSYGAFLSHHIIIVQVLGFFRDKHLTLLPQCLLLGLCLVLAYGLSFVLTHLTTIVISKFLQNRPLRQG